ncbi:MAG: M56 family metallopeptidase, partial [Rhodohalobacter sp.]
MDVFIFQLSEFAQLVFETTWLPLVIWTVISFGVWFFLQMFENVHPIYQYHTRLALIFSLPAGLLSLASIHYISDWITASAGDGLTMITVISPIDISFTQVEESSGIPFMVIVQSLAVAIFFSGMIFFLIRFCMHAINLKKLRKSLNYRPISEMTSLSPENRGLALATGKNVQVAFLNSEIIPVTFGFRKPVILLPDTLKSQPEKLNLALRHELTHITQHDFFSHLMVILTEAVFWFHPLVHRLKRELVEYREMRCDNIVLSEASVSRKEYASLLLELIPMPNLNKELSVNMAQESSNLKKRITMITQQSKTKPIPKQTSLILLGVIFISTALAMACTDMQTQNVFDEEELDLMTNIDKTGEQGFHEIIIYMSEEEQAERHESKLEQLRMLEPEHIESVHVWKGD